MTVVHYYFGHLLVDGRSIDMDPDRACLGCLPFSTRIISGITQTDRAKIGVSPSVGTNSDRDRA